MVKIPGSNSYKAIKQQWSEKQAKLKAEAEERIKEAKEYLEPRLKKTAAKASEFISDVQFSIKPPKLEVLGKEVTKLQREVLFKSTFLNELQRRVPEQTILIYQRQKELQKLEEKARIAIEKYNKFAAQQAAAQKAFDDLNGFKR
ncbi:MAG: hypothetical protein KHX03_02775 [Clostridium sp.]|nr:hypothetical protein [Clostridium sp.]